MNDLDFISVAFGILIGGAIVMIVLGISYGMDQANKLRKRLVSEAHTEQALENARERPADANIRHLGGRGTSANR